MKLKLSQGNILLMKKNPQMCILIISWLSKMYFQMIRRFQMLPNEMENNKLIVEVV